MIDLDAASRFMATPARPLDRCRFEVIVRGASADRGVAMLQSIVARVNGSRASEQPRTRSYTPTEFSVTL